MKDNKIHRKEYWLEKIQNGEVVRITRCYHEAGTGDPGDKETQNDLATRPFVSFENESEWVVSENNRELLKQIRYSEKGK